MATKTTETTATAASTEVASVWSLIKTKLLSRKFWMALIGVAIGAVLIWGIQLGDVETVVGSVVSVVQALAGAITAVISVVAYIKTEGAIDEAGIKKLTEAAEEIAEVFEEVQEAVEDITETKEENDNE